MITQGEQMLALRRARLAASPPFLRGAFRPFFFFGAIWAVVAVRQSRLRAEHSAHKF